MGKRNRTKNSSPLHNVLSVDEQIAKLQIAKSMELEKALKSNDIDMIYKAQSYLQQIDQKDTNIKPQSILVDPLSYSADGYKTKSFRLSYEMLRAMGQTSIIKAIIETRKEQIMPFLRPQKDKYSKGFVIRPKKAKVTDSGIKLTKEQEKRIEEITEFLLHCGENANSWHGDDLDSLTRKFIHDSLTLDQGTFECVENRAGDLCEVIATDGATYRIADTHNDERDSNNLKKGEKNGYMPYFVQVYNSRIIAEFYPWELCFGIRNPQTSIYQNGYGRSELEDLIENVTSMLNADMYNANYFKVGSNPKGILRVSGNVNQNRLEEFKNHWQATMAGVRNAHKLMVVDAEKMDFINTQASNKDMEYAKYQEFLIKISCAHYRIDPSEIGFPMSGNSEGGGAMFEGSNKHRLEFSKEKGLKPLLSYVQKCFHKYIVERYDSDYEFIFEGTDIESPEMELENDIKAVQNWATINEVRSKRGMKPIEGGDIVANPVYLQAQQMKMQGDQGSNAFVDQNGDGEGDNKPDEENPFMKALDNDLKKIFEAA